MSALDIGLRRLPELWARYDAKLQTGNTPWEHLTFAAKLEIGVRSQESGEKRKKEEGRSQKKCFYKYEMLPTPFP
jgi:hypothetical protein